MKMTLRSVVGGEGKKGNFCDQRKRAILNGRDECD